jgi:hypothetical protein
LNIFYGIFSADCYVQFLKFQAFAEQLTKETSDLKVKIEGHKRENRRLASLIDQQKDDAARLTLRLSGTEKQRDDALEALVLQQEIAEELERERKRNQKEISALQHTCGTLSRQRDEAQRVVLHLRSLINGQTHHMEHIIRTLGNAPELSEYIEEGYEDIDDENEISGRDSVEVGSIRGVSGLKSHSRLGAVSRSSTPDGRSPDGEDVTPEMESHLLNTCRQSKRFSQLSMSDVADRHLRDKTDAIAEIIRSISEQCAAAVEGLHLAQDADFDEAIDPRKQGRHGSNPAPTDDGNDHSIRADGSELGDNDGSFLAPDGRHSSIPPTPDLVHNRSSTSMSMVSSSTVPERSSQQYSPGDVPTKIVEDDDEHVHETEGVDAPIETTLSKQPSRDIVRPGASQIMA